jgi:hypothetical protein
MADDQENPAPAPNGAAEPPRQSLREIAEAAYDDLTAEPSGDAAAEPQVDEGAQARDARGRFVPKESGTEPGEAAGQKPTQPREDQTQPQDAHPAPQGSSSEPPANWNAADKETFAKLAPEGQQFLLKRHSEMEGDYQRRVQQVRGAAEFTEALAPVFNDPVLSGSMQQSGMTPYGAIREWAGFHKRALSPNPEDRVQLLFDLAARMQIDPAVFATSRSGQPGLPEEALADPAIKFFADHLGRTSTEVQALRAQIQYMQEQAAAGQRDEAVRVTRWGIDAFADEKGPDGKLLRPDFDQVIDQIVDLIRINPERDIREAYETARWMAPATRQTMLDAQRNSVEQKQSNQRAAQAVRSNLRGMTSPVAKPASDTPKGLRATIEAAAEEIGLN